MQRGSVRSPYAAVVLSGGRARRFGGLAKAELRLGESRLIDLVLAAVSDAEPRVVVGPETILPPRVRRVREEPPGGGPVAGLAAGLAELPAGADVAAVLAADLPFLTRAVVRRLQERVADGPASVDGAVLVDGTGRDQLLIGVWRVPILRARISDLPVVPGASLRHLFAALDVARVSWDVPAGTAPPWWDCDSAEDMQQAREWWTT